MMDLDQLDQRLKYAAESGDTDALYALIKEDPYILERVDKVPFVDTPLHTASRVGHVNFVREVMRLKPSFAKKLNQDGLYPIHLAVMERQFEVLRALLRSDKGLARLQGREGKTCLHYAAAKGDLVLLDTLLLACPQSMQDVTDASETALHIALKLSNLDAFYLLLRTLRTACHQGSAEEEGRILNFKDVEGNTVLHIAVSMNQPQIVKQLVHIGAELNHENTEGLTAMDFSAKVQGENAEVMRKTLVKAGARSASAVPKASNHHVLTSILPFWNRLTIYLIRYKKDMSPEARSLLLIVCVLIATVTYHAALAPPRNNNDNNNISLVLNFTANSSTPNIINVTHSSLNHNRINSTSGADPLFWTSNIVGLSSSTLLVILLLPGKYIFSLMYIPLYCFIYCYTVTTSITGSWLWFAITLFLWILLSNVLLLMYKVSKRIKERKKRLSLALLQEDLHY